MLARSLSLLGLVVMSAAAHAAAPGGPCADAEGRVAIVEAGRETDIAALFAPHRLGAELNGLPGWTLAGIAVEGSSIVAKVEGPGGAEGTLTLRAPECRPNDPTASASFVFEPPEGGVAGVVALREAVKANDGGGFWRQRVQLAPESGGGTRDARAAAPHSTPSLGGINDNSTVIVLLFLLALLALLADLPAALRDPAAAGGPSARNVALLVLGITLLGGLLRVLAGPTFIREAYPLPPIALFLDGRLLGHALKSYPMGPEIIAAIVGRLHPGDPYAVWFDTNLLLGTLTIPAAYLLGAALLDSRPAGLLAAALLASWPQHIRVSASEATHVALVLSITVAMACALVAARSGRLRSFLAAVLTAAALVVIRPEAALALPALGVLALFAGEGVRSKWRSPARWIALAAALWLIFPSLVAIAGHEAPAAPGQSSAAGIAVGVDTPLATLAALVLPDGRNGLFDARTTPIWLYPLALVGLGMLWRRGRRGAAAGLALFAISFYALYATLGPAVTLWKMGRYHATLLPFGVAAVTAGIMLGLDAIGLRLGRPWSPSRRALAGAVIAAVGCAAWWPAVAGLRMDWQIGTEWPIELGRRHPELNEPATEVRIVVPDNRRRFLDLSPRGAVEPLTGGRQRTAAGVTVAHAFESLGVGGRTSPPAYYYEGLYCSLAVARGEDFNPQCSAMHRVFELEPVDTLTIDAPAYLSSYVDFRLEPPLRLALYRVGDRKLDPAAALALLPAPYDVGGELRDDAPMGAPTANQMEPPEPPL